MSACDLSAADARRARNLAWACGCPTCAAWRRVELRLLAAPRERRGPWRALGEAVAALRHGLQHAARHPWRGSGPVRQVE